jgi:hypothetical protein
MEMRNKKSGTRNLLILLAAFIGLFSSCATTLYDREFIKVEDSYYSGKDQEAVTALRDLAETGRKKEMLLYSMEAGILFHSMGDLDSSDRAFRQADEIAQSISRDQLEEMAAYWLNENSQKYIGQNFERVLIKYYLVLNQMARGNLENARALFRQIDYELRDMKFFDELYKQNGAARYLNAVVSEQLGEYNDSRVQLKNLRQMFPEREREIGAAQYVLAVEEGASRDIEAFSPWADEVLAFNQKGERVPYRKGMAEIVLLNYAGQSAVKNSRGRIREEPRLLEAFRSSLSTRPEIKDSLQNLMYILQDAENPIPEYVRRDPAGSRRVQIMLQGEPVGLTQPFFNYSETAVRHFNDHYLEMIDKNIDSLSAKVAAAVAAGEASAVAATALNAFAASQGNSDQVSVSDARQAGVGIAAAQIYQTIAPDLRCWRLLPDNYQLIRIFVEPGKYELDILPPETARSTREGAAVELEEKDFRFITFHTMSNDRQRYRLIGQESAVVEAPTTSKGGTSAGAPVSQEDPFARRSIEMDIASFIHFLYTASAYPLNIDEAQQDDAANSSIVVGDYQQNLFDNFGLGLRYHIGLHGKYTGIGGPYASDLTALRFNTEVEARYTILGQANQGLWAGGGLGAGFVATELAKYENSGYGYEEISVENGMESFAYGILSAGYRAVIEGFSIHPYLSLKFGPRADFRLSSDSNEQWVSGRFRAGLMAGRSF